MQDSKHSDGSEEDMGKKTIDAMVDVRKTYGRTGLVETVKSM